ncbi:uncharacterized protein BO96DRAFT_462572 [Aspergillus niger CBS 101883]|uniref:Uncharacterized protein n=2 Tax=Aspergillus niger TaxID=5061 RepID=A2R7Z6_ASPNC|nr:uncharacterized protein BO96DRAFT_462572 [Aspergillus niger CBS 101883]XP_059606560.1 hypothetical protein An16g05300 [Aspergillus niger]PYH61444.1 hypothetical protein BO96DRAFT_462572 [Aspergillus niger CBS 101883]CAK97384.1 hypothetical protein An16g05300 [Aspergillus niger]
MCSEATRISSHTHRDEAHPTRSERVSGTMIDRFCTDGETPPRPRNSFPWAQLLSRVPAECAQAYAATNEMQHSPTSFIVIGVYKAGHMVKHHIDRRNYQQPVSDWIPILPGPSGSGGEGTHADKVSPGDRHTCARNPERFDNDNTSAGLPPRLTISVRPDNHLSHGVDYHHPGLSIRMLGGVDIIPAVGTGLINAIIMPRSPTLLIPRVIGNLRRVVLRADREAVIAAASNRYHQVLPCASPSAKLQLSISAPSDVDLASRHVKLDALHDTNPLAREPLDYYCQVIAASTPECLPVLATAVIRLSDDSRSSLEDGVYLSSTWHLTPIVMEG